MIFASISLDTGLCHRAYWTLTPSLFHFILVNRDYKSDDKGKPLCFAQCVCVEHAECFDGTDRMDIGYTGASVRVGHKTLGPRRILVFLTADRQNAGSGVASCRS